MIKKFNWLLTNSTNAVNAEKASGFVSQRKLPVLLAITKRSLLNKLITLPIAFLLNAFAPWAVIEILVLGGLYLAYEGAEKISQKRGHSFIQILSGEQIRLNKNRTIRLTTRPKSGLSSLWY